MVVEIANLVKKYKEITAVNDLSLGIKKGEIFGLLGPNGSGKTTTINCILSLLSFDEGKIKIFGKDMHPNAYDIKRDIGVVFQEVAVFDELTVQENIDYFCGLYVTDKILRKQYVQEAIEFVGLNDFVKFYPKKLSGGLLRRLNIACGIAHKPKLIIFDEPTVAVDPQSRNNILEGIVRLNKEGATILYTSHYMEEIEQICTSIAIMDKGQIVAEGSCEELKSKSFNGEKINLEINFEDISQFADKISKMNFVLNAVAIDRIIHITAKKNTHALLQILEYCKKSDVPVISATCILPTLNDVFLEITGKELRDNV